MEMHLETTGCCLPYGITQCYLPPDTSERTPPYLQPVKAGTRFTDPGGMEGWVDLGALITPGSGVEPLTARSEVWRPNRCATDCIETTHVFPFLIFQLHWTSADLCRFEPLCGYILTKYPHKAPTLFRLFLFRFHHMTELYATQAAGFTRCWCEQSTNLCDWRLERHGRNAHDWFFPHRKTTKSWQKNTTLQNFCQFRNNYYNCAR